MPAFHDRAATATEAVVTVPTDKAHALRRFAEDFAFEQEIAPERAHVGGLVVAGEIVGIDTHRHGEPRLAGLAIAEQHRRLPVRIKLLQLVARKQRIEHLAVMFQNQPVLGESEDMRAVVREGSLDRFLVAVLGVPVKLVFRKGGEAAGFRVRGIRREDGMIHCESVSRNLAMKLFMSSSA